MRSKIFGEIERRDVVFRLKSTGKLPFAIGMDDYKKEIDELIAKAESGELTEAEAVTRITKIMEKYYGQVYPLREA